MTLAQIGSNDGTVNWKFAVDNKLPQSLAKGETVTAVYTVTVKDDSGTSPAAVTQDFTVTTNCANQQIIVLSDGSPTFKPVGNSDVGGGVYAVNGVTVVNTSTSALGKLVQSGGCIGVGDVYSTEVNSPELCGTHESVRLVVDAPETSTVFRHSSFFPSGAQYEAKESAPYAVTYVDDYGVQQTTAFAELVATSEGKTSCAATEMKAMLPQQVRTGVASSSVTAPVTSTADRIGASFLPATTISAVAWAAKPSDRY